jgi:hypothetical protein
MLTPATILRDSAVAGLLLGLLGSLRSPEVGGAIAAGALASLANLALLWRAVSSAGVGADAVVLARISFKTMAGAVIFLVLVANFPVGPALIGFCSVLLALSVRAFASLGVTARTSTPEPG